MNSHAEIESFLTPKKLAFIGVSGNPKKFSRLAFKELTKKGFDIYPVNPKLDEIDGKKCCHEIPELPDDVKHALFMTPKPQTDSELIKALEKGIDHIWIQQGAHTNQIEKLVNGKDVKVVNNKCIMMFAQPVGSIHKFHRFFVKVFGKYPR